MPTIDSIINLKRYGKPKSNAQQLMIGMTNKSAIKMMNGAITWVWSNKISINKMSEYFKSKCLSQSDEVNFIFQQ